MQLTSPAFREGERIPMRYTCEGENINPPLFIREVPPLAKSLALIMEDPDVPKQIRPDGMWDHWVVFNLSPTLIEIKAGEEPRGIHGIRTDGQTGYFGPCPPDREHRYYFKAYALDALLHLAPRSTKQQVVAAMQDHILAKAGLMGRYEKRRLGERRP
ncbi:MAG: YbhB/YbcL family Raf kinase inhibitor-like protein [Gammaproteobacteria bacterium]|nr:YbhB/YbcL family Raf kinase inhibitor-like protein [Gammaproteobacteria bacterium]